MLPRVEPKYEGHYAAYETLDDALIKYEALSSRDDVYSASICTPITSTDYDSDMYIVAWTVEL